MTDNPLIITCAIVGAELTRKDTPYLPLTPDELAISAKEAVDAGASIIHLHIRDEDGHPTQRVDLFEKVTKKIGNLCDCIIQYSTGGATGTVLKDRCAPLTLRPEMATISMGTMNFGSDIFENSELTIVTIAKIINEYGIMPELEIFDCAMMETAYRLIKNGCIPEKFHVDFVLGVAGGMGGDINNLVFLVNRLNSGQSWSVAGAGRFQLPLTAHAIAMGGHVRIGLEDNIYYKKGELVKSNAQLVERVVRIANEMERTIATTNQARDILRL